MTERDRFSPVGEHLQNGHRIITQDRHQGPAWPPGREPGESSVPFLGPSPWLARSHDRGPGCGHRVQAALGSVKKLNLYFKGCDQGVGLSLEEGLAALEFLQKKI